MKNFNTETKLYKLFKAMHDGETITPEQARNRFGVQNIRAEATRIRQRGYAVYHDRKTLATNGTTVERVTEYSIGQPSREVIAAGYKALARGLV